MKYLVIGYNAVKSIVSHRKLQSIEYQECKEFISFITGDIGKLKLWDLKLVTNNDGGIIFSKTYNLTTGVIFDLTTFKAFNNGVRKSEILIIIQKILRFAIRNYDGHALSSAERNIDDEMTLIYPFSSSNHEAYRICIDRSPDKKRMQKRGNFILVFADGNTKKFEKPSTYTIFRKAFNAIKETKVSFNDNDKDVLDTIGVVNLDSSQNLSIDSNIGFEKWQFFLTENQKSFVERPISGPERLEGAAGTGKTLTLILRAIFLINKYKQDHLPINILFITHSISTKNQIINIFQANCPEILSFMDRSHSEISIKITTLQELSLNYLGAGIGENEYLDRDAQDSKDYQLMIIEESYDSARNEDFETYKEFCSTDFIDFFENIKKEELLEMLQHEIAVSIKGKANEDIEKYRKLIRFRHSIPAQNTGDLNFLFLIYNKYQSRLTKTGQFDSDDIILTTLGKLDTPIWRRRKELEGFDVTFIDETHLFNFNELSVFHHLNKEASKNNIIFAIDKSQAVGDKGLTDSILYDSLGIEELDNGSGNSFSYKTVFRSSPSIVNLAFEVLSSGATLFTNFENPLNKVEFSFTSEEEKKSKQPKYLFRENNDALIKEAFLNAENICKELNTKKSKVLIIATSSQLLSAIEIYAKNQHKPFELLKNRGDAEVIKSAEKSNRYVIGGIDYVGGLEFEAVIIIGVDKNRVPPIISEDNLDSHHFLNYAWHNRMYVAITRAKYILILIGDKTRGESKLFESAINKKILHIE
jgi:superfamily I DNA/RNA helicase